ncbi:hypothetical protein NA78x_005740 [Anatilimnocola sp. NA78]|uniref:hypothetical protein n=1 Tax=Anatilimnocola sp. NA78 TaxID=3415683 RepID=UPI003CE58D5A
MNIAFSRHFEVCFFPSNEAMMFRLHVFAFIAALVHHFATEPAAAQFIAELPGKATVELVAVVDLKADPVVAWQPDGKPLEVAKEWPDITRVNDREAPFTLAGLFRARIEWRA